MKDIDKTKERLINEVAELRQLIAELETSEAERKLAEEALRESQVELSAIFDNAPIVMIFVDRERRVRKVNRGTVEFTGRPAEEMIGLRGGEALRCLHSLDDPKGCGFGPFCETCTVRNTVLDTFETGKSHHRVEANLPFARGEKQEELAFLVSTTLLSVPKDQMVLVCIEDITERKRAEEAIRRRNEELATLNAIAATVSQSLDLKECLDAALEKTLAVLDIEGGLIYLFDKTSQTFAPAVHHGISQDVLREVTGFKIGQGLSGWVAESGEPLIVADLSADPRNISSAASREGLRSYTGVPIKSKGEVLGVMTLVTHQEGHFRPDHVDLLIHIGNQIGVAIENARLYQETTRQLEEMEALGAVTTALTRSLDLDQVLQSIVDSAIRLIPASISGVIHLADETAGKLIPRAASPGVRIQEKSEMSIGEGIAGLVMQEKRPINVSNVEEDPRFLTMDTASPNKSLLTAPLTIDGDCIGTLSLNSDQVGAFSAEDERLLTTLAAQAAVAVRNARLHQEVQHRVEELTFLNQVGRAVTSSLDLEQILTTVMEETALVLKTEAGSILLLDEESSELVFKAAVGPRSEELIREDGGLRLPLEQGVAGWVVREGQPLLVPDVRDDPRFYPGIDEATGFVTKSLLAVPLKARGKVIGAIEAVNKTEDDFGQADVTLLSSMAQWAAIAIENARLYKDLQDRMEELKRTQAQLIQSAKLAAIGELAAGVAHEINNPLTSIIGFTRLLLRGVEDDDPMKEDLEIIDREAARTKAIVRGLLDFARQREPQLAPADINEIVRSTIPLAHHQAKVTRVIIKESYDETLPLVLLDADQIKQVLLNMMTNAIQAMPEGGKLKVVTAYRPQAQSPEPVEGQSPDGSIGPVLSLTSASPRPEARPEGSVEPSKGSPQRLAEGPVLSEAGPEPSRRVEGWSPACTERSRGEPAEGMAGVDCVAVEFHDTGTGISAEDLPRIFEPFFTTKEAGRGTGLGLSISHNIVERHGGWIEVESKVGRGSIFTVMLPVAEGQREGRYDRRKNSGD